MDEDLMFLARAAVGGDKEALRRFNRGVERINDCVVKHEIKKFEQCSLFNSSYQYSDGYDVAICSCGWKSAASKKHEALVALFKIHVDGAV